MVSTDVESSTDLWEWDKHCAMRSIDLHDKIMRTKMAEFNGFEARPHPAGSC